MSVKYGEFPYFTQKTQVLWIGIVKITCFSH